MGIHSYTSSKLSFQIRKLYPNKYYITTAIVHNGRASDNKYFTISFNIHAWLRYRSRVNNIIKMQTSHCKINNLLLFLDNLEMDNTWTKLIIVIVLSKLLSKYWILFTVSQFNICEFCGNRNQGDCLLINRIPDSLIPRFSWRDPFLVIAVGEIIPRTAFAR